MLVLNIFCSPLLISFPDLLMMSSLPWERQLHPHLPWCSTPELSCSTPELSRLTDFFLKRPQDPSSILFFLISKNAECFHWSLPAQEFSLSSYLSLVTEHNPFSSLGCTFILSVFNYFLSNYFSVLGILLSLLFYFFMEPLFHN